MLEVFGYIASALIGISLGVIGGGGSILTVPVLVYLFGLSATMATSYSLFIVGLTALVGSFSYFRRSEVDLPVAVSFGAPSILAVYLTRSLVMPRLPDQIGGLKRDTLLLILFAILMILASAGMIRPQKVVPQEFVAGSPGWIVLAEGLGVGFLTGLLGAGGGFLIIPVLVLLARLPMKTAIGTSLVIIAFKSLIGFGGDLQRAAAIDWGLLLTISGIAILGIAIGTWLSRRVSGEKLKPAFGYFVLVLGTLLILKETLWAA